MKNLYYFLLIGMLISCSGNRHVDKALLPELDEMDYEVISAAIDIYLEKYMKGIYSKEDSVFYEGLDYRPPLAIIIPDSTNIKHLSNWQYDNHKDKKFNDKYLLDRIKILNKNKYKIDLNKITSVKVYSNIINGTVFNLEKMHKLYANIWGSFCFSKPSINIHDDIAVIYIYHIIDSKSERGDYMWLRKENSKWKLIDIWGVWES